MYIFLLPQFQDLPKATWIFLEEILKMLEVLTKKMYLRHQEMYFSFFPKPKFQDTMLHSFWKETPESFTLHPLQWKGRLPKLRHRQQNNLVWSSQHVRNNLLLRKEVAHTPLFCMRSQSPEPQVPVRPPTPLSILSSTKQLQHGLFLLLPTRTQVRSPQGHTLFSRLVPGMVILPGNGPLGSQS